MDTKYIALQYDSEELLDTDGFLQWLQKNGKNCSVNLLRADLDTELLEQRITEYGMKLVESSDGLIGEVRDNGQGSDLSRSSSKFVLHTDGPYYNVPPEIVVLSCVESSQNGREIPTIFCDTKQLIASLSNETVQVLGSVDFVYHGREEKEFRRPLIEILSRKEVWISNFGGRGHLVCNDEKTYDFYTWFNACNIFFEKIFADTSQLIAHNYKKYDTIVFNNHQFLHGRENLTGEADFQRTLHRIWIDYN